MEQAVEIMAGISLLAVGLSYLFRPKDWAVWLEAVREQDRSASLSFGMISILIGSFIAGFHWVWDGMAMIVTIIGVIFIIKGSVYMLFPGWLPAKITMLMPRYNPLLRVSGIVLIALALAVLYPLYQAIKPGG